MYPDNCLEKPDFACFNMKVKSHQIKWKETLEKRPSCTIREKKGGEDEAAA